MSFVTSIEIAYRHSNAKDFKLVHEINFYYNDELITSYSNLDHAYIKTDLTSKIIKFDDARHFYYTNERKGRKEDTIHVFVNKKTYLKLLMYCISEWKYDASISESDELEIVAELFKKMY